MLVKRKRHTLVSRRANKSSKRGQNNKNSYKPPDDYIRWPPQHVFNHALHSHCLGRNFLSRSSSHENKNKDNQVHTMIELYCITLSLTALSLSWKPSSLSLCLAMSPRSPPCAGTFGEPRGWRDGPEQRLWEAQSTHSACGRCQFRHQDNPYSTTTLPTAVHPSKYNKHRRHRQYNSSHGFAEVDSYAGGGGETNIGRNKKYLIHRMLLYVQKVRRHLSVLTRWVLRGENGRNSLGEGGVGV